MIYFDLDLLTLLASCFCVNSLKLQSAHFGKIFEGRTFVQTYTESAWKCIENCVIRPKCESINFHTKLRKCQLNYEKGDNSDLTSAPGWLYLDQFTNVLPTGVTNGCQHSEVYNMDTQSCETRECPISEDFENVRANGNVKGIGARVLLSCPNKRYPLNPGSISLWPIQSVCQSNGAWTVPSLECGKLEETCSTFVGYNYDRSWSGFKKINNIRLVTECKVTATFTASSAHGGYVNQYGADKARLDSTAWVADQSDALPYIQITFDKKIRTTGLTTLARPIFVVQEYVTSYNVTYGKTESQCLNGPTEVARDTNNMTVRL